MGLILSSHVLSQELMVQLLRTGGVGGRLAGAATSALRANLGQLKSHKTDPAHSVLESGASRVQGSVPGSARVTAAVGSSCCCPGRGECQVCGGRGQRLRSRG